MAGNAHDERPEKERGDDYLDEAEEDGAEELKLQGDGGRVVAQFGAGEEAHEDPRRERAAADRARGD